MWLHTEDIHVQESHGVEGKEPGRREWERLRVGNGVNMIPIYSVPICNCKNKNKNK